MRGESYYPRAQKLTLHGYFADVKYGKMVFKFIDGGEITDIGSTTRTYRRLSDAAAIALGPLYTESEKSVLAGTGPTVTLPYTDKGFKVLLPNWIKPDNVALRVGSICEVKVAMRPFEITSEATHNAGETVRGVSLVLLGFGQN